MSIFCGSPTNTFDLDFKILFCPLLVSFRIKVMLFPFTLDVAKDLKIYFTREEMGHFIYMISLCVDLHEKIGLAINLH